MPITKERFGTTQDAKPVERYMLSNSHGMEVGIITYGGIVQSLKVPDSAGGLADIVLGFDTLEPYLGEHPYFGALIGRYANRIANGHFELDGVLYKLACNNGSNHLHGGVHGFNKQVWQATIAAAGSEPELLLTLQSPTGDEGYPGKLDVEVGYTLTANNELRITYRAQTDAPTIVNLTNHSYFNFSMYPTSKGNNNGADCAIEANTILGHRIQIFASHYLPVDARLIPSGELAAVAGTGMDFTGQVAIADRLDGQHVQIQRASGGYDHSWVLDAMPGTTQVKQLKLAAQVEEPLSGRKMSVFTTQPAIQFYTGNFLDGSLRGKQGLVYDKHSGFCLETQHYPDSPNHPDFPSTMLRPGEHYVEETVYKFE